MTHRLGTRLLAVLLPATALLPAGAHAEKVVTEDAAGDVRTPRGTFDVSAERLWASRPQVAVTRRHGEAFECRGLSANYDGAADLVAVSVPASCIGSPRWVVLGVGASSSPEADAENPSTVILLADDGDRDTIRENSIGKGPRIHRG